MMIAAWLGHTETLVELVKGNANLDLQNKVSIDEFCSKLCTLEQN